MAKKITLSGYVGGELTETILREQLPTDDSPVEFTLSSMGGYVSEGIVIHNMIREYKGEKSIVLSGIVASIASYISMAVPKKDRYVYDNTVFMIHNAMGGNFGDHRVMAEESALLRKMDNLIASAYAAESGKTKEEILDLMGVGSDNKGSWFFGQEIIDAGFADNLIESGETLEKDGAVAVAVNGMRNMSIDTKKILEDYRAVAKILESQLPEPAPKPEPVQPKKDKPMEKTELLAECKKQGVTLDEVAQAIGAKDLDMLNSVKQVAGDDPVKAFNDLKDRERKVFLTENFGPEKYENGTENTLRAYASKVLVEMTNEAIEAFKKDPVAVQLAGAKADVDSHVNQIGKTDKQGADTGAAVVVDY
jgi:ATP-dependent protease ClpP protease subunit